MRIELNDEAAGASIAAIIVTGIATISMFGCQQSEKTAQELERTQQEAIKAGLVQRLEPVRTDHKVIWSKQ